MGKEPKFDDDVSTWLLVRWMVFDAPLIMLWFVLWFPSAIIFRLWRGRWPEVI